ncbi:MAG: CHAD domain-containing protein [Chloroflexi bacterium]|nr:CHAD domain-containing protein [Chloroflexota bacterium]
MEKTISQHEELIAVLKEVNQPLSPDDLMAEAGRKVLLAELINMLEHEDGSRTGEDIEDVHDMRVAIRRMRSALRLLEPYFKAKAITPYVQKMQKIARSLGTVRDLDVQIEDLEKYAADLPEETRLALDKGVVYLKQKRDKARDRLIDAFDRGSYQRFVKDFSAFLTSPGKGARSGDSEDILPIRLRHILPEMIYRHLGSVRAYEDVLPDADLPTLHALRIEFKRLRYVVSLFGDVLGSTTSDFIEEMKLIQDHLGKLNDISVAQEHLTDLMNAFSPGKHDDVLAALQEYVERLEEKKTTLCAGVPAMWQRFNTKKVQRHLAMAIAAL